MEIREPISMAASPAVIAAHERATTGIFQAAGPPRTNVFFSYFGEGNIFFFFLWKISPELTSAANPPLFAEEDWP